MDFTLVTGGAKRLGAQICIELAKNGSNLIVHYNTSQQEAFQIVEECHSYGVEAQCVQGNFSTLQSTQDFIHRLLERYPNIGNLVNNVGTFIQSTPLQTTPEQWHELFQLNLHSPVEIIRGLISGIINAKGSIVNIGVAGLQTARAIYGSSAYHSAKYALLMTTKSLAYELAPHQVRVNMVSPGQLDISTNRPDNPTTLPMQRLGTSLEVANVVAFLMNIENQYITGQNIEVAGGLGL